MLFRVRSAAFCAALHRHRTLFRFCTVAGHFGIGEFHEVLRGVLFDTIGVVAHPRLQQEKHTRKSERRQNPWGKEFCGEASALKHSSTPWATGPTSPGPVALIGELERGLNRLCRAARPLSGKLIPKSNTTGVVSSRYAGRAAAGDAGRRVGGAAGARPARGAAQTLERFLTIAVHAGR